MYGNEGRQMAISKRTVPIMDKDGKPVKDKDGTDKKRTVGYTVTVSAPNPTGRGRGTRHTIGTYRLKDDAEAAERAAKGEIQRGSFQPAPPEPAAPAKVWTVADVVAGWLAGRKATVSANTHSQYESAYRLHVRDALGDRDITTLSRADVKAALRTWQEAGMGAQLQNRAMLVLRCALDESVDDGILAANPAAGIKLPSPRSRRDIPHWRPEHLRAFLGAGERDQLGVFWAFAALEGLRRAEALGLRWSDLHWSPDETGCRATIVQTVVPNSAHGGAPLVQPKPKTRGSQRTVTLTAPTVAALKRHRDRQAFQRRDRGDVWPDGLDLIVTNELGDVVRPDAVRRHRLAVIAASGVPDPGTHGLRHLAATAMLRAGVSPAIVAAKIGHADIGLTVGTYGHLLPSDQSTANDALEAFFARESAKPTGT